MLAKLTNLTKFMLYNDKVVNDLDLKVEEKIQYYTKIINLHHEHEELCKYYTKQIELLNDAISEIMHRLNYYERLMEQKWFVRNTNEDEIHLF